MYNIFMDEKIYFLTNELKKEMENDPRFIRLDELEKKMNDDESVIRLVIKKDTLNDKYNDLSRFYKDDDPELIKARREFMDAKKELESHRDLLMEVNDILFSDFKGKRC